MNPCQWTLIPWQVVFGSLDALYIIQRPPNGVYWEVQVNGNHVKVLLDTGSAVSLIQPSLLPRGISEKALIPVTCVHGDVIEAAKPGTWHLEVEVLKELPVPLLLGRDWPGLDYLVLLQQAQPGVKADNQNLNPAPSLPSWQWKVR